MTSKTTLSALFAALALAWTPLVFAEAAPAGSGGDSHAVAQGEGKKGCHKRADEGCENCPKKKFDCADCDKKAKKGDCENCPKKKFDCADCDKKAKKGDCENCPKKRFDCSGCKDQCEKCESGDCEKCESGDCEKCDKGECPKCKKGGCENCPKKKFDCADCKDECEKCESGDCDKCKKGKCGKCPKTRTASNASDSDAELPGIRILSVNDAEALRQAGPVTFVDANGERTRQREGIIPGATLLTSSSGFDPATELPEDKSIPLVFYCANIRCSAAPAAAERALAEGHTNVAVLSVGIAGWKEAGKATAKVPRS